MAAVNLALDAADGKEKEPAMASEEQRQEIDVKVGSARDWGWNSPQYYDAREAKCQRTRMQLRKSRGTRSSVEQGQHRCPDRLGPGRPPQPVDQSRIAAAFELLLDTPHLADTELKESGRLDLGPVAVEDGLHHLEDITFTLAHLHTIPALYLDHRVPPSA